MLACWARAPGASGATGVRAGGSRRPAGHGLRASVPGGVSARAGPACGCSCAFSRQPLPPSPLCSLAEIRQGPRLLSASGCRAAQAGRRARLVRVDAGRGLTAGSRRGGAREAILVRVSAAPLPWCPLFPGKLGSSALPGLGALVPSQGLGELGVGCACARVCACVYVCAEGEVRLGTHCFFPLPPSLLLATGFLL